MQDAWRAYLELALGLTEASRQKAQNVAKKLVGQGGATAAQLQALAEELVATSAANREALTKLVRFEVDRALGVVGLATAEEVADLNSRVRELERDLREARALAAATPPATPVSGPAKGSIGAAVVAEAMADAAGVPTAEAVAAKGVVKKTVAKKAIAKKAVPEKAVVKKTVAKKAIAKKAVPEKAVARRTTPTTAIAKKTAARQVGAAGAPSAAQSGVVRKAAAKKQPPAAGTS